MGAAGFYLWRRRSHELAEGISLQANNISAARFEILADASPIGIFLNDPSGACTYTNPRWQEITGVGFDESLGDGWQQMIHPDDLEKVFTEWNATVAAGMEFSYEFRLLTPLGETRWLHSRASRVDNIDDDALAYIGTTEDITERRELSLQLLLAEKRFALALRGTADGLWDWDIDSGGLYLSERYCELLGYTQGALAPAIETFENLMHPDDKASAMAAIEHHLETREPYAIEMRMKTKSHGYCWFSAGGQAEWDEDGRATRIAGSIRDISERREIERHMRLTDASIERSSEIAFRVAALGQVTYANPASCRALGYTLEEITTLSIWEINLGLTAEKWSASWNREDQDASTTFESNYRRRDGSTFPVEVTSNLIDVDGEKFACGYVQDISERHDAERTARRYTEALQRSNQELEQFAYISSHDLQEPFRKIQAFGDRLKASSGDVLGEKRAGLP
ncbi:MAG: PAS domain S-box-containing protein [Gammaproteobacteria bacterium]